MNNKLLHTPDGVRDIYGEECAKKMILQEKLHQVIRGYGYEPIQTPSFEFFDIFSKDIGTTPSRELFKFFDRDGNTLVLRPDITPSIARCVSKYYHEETDPIRFSYVGNTYKNNTSYQGRLKENTQIGAELIYDSSADADAEMIALTIEGFLKAGLQEFQISVGHVGFFQAICDAAGIDEDTESDIRDLILTKNYYAAYDLIKQASTSDAICAIFEALPTFTGTMEMLERAQELTKDIPKAKEAIWRLEAVYDLLSAYGYDQYVAFDLSFLSKYDYYTGIIFEGYTFGSGEAIATGGRYDKLLDYFGKNAPAVGSVFMVDPLIVSLNRQNIDIEIPVTRTLLVYDNEHCKEAISLAKSKRLNGETVILVSLDALDVTAQEYAKARGIDNVEWLTEEANR